jgi:hypothetical protein
MVLPTKLTEAKGTISSLCESFTMPEIIFVCPNERLEAKISITTNSKALQYFIRGQNTNLMTASRIFCVSRPKKG